MLTSRDLSHHLRASNSELAPFLGWDILGDPALLFGSPSRHGSCLSSCVVSALVRQVLDEIRPYLVGTGGGGLENAGLDGPIVKVNFVSACHV